MNRHPIPDYPMEPERYELSDDPAYRFELTRRQFFGLLGGGIVVLLLLDEALAQQEPGRARRGGGGGSVPAELGAWLHVAEDGTVTVYTGKVEVGQNARTSLTQVVAEELRVPIDSIRVVMADTDLTPFDMGTFGSRTTPVMVPQLRKVAAATRELLIGLAADQWQVARDTVTVSDGRVTHSPTSRSLTFGQLTRGQKLLQTVGEDPPTTPPDKWTVAGRSVPKVNARDMVTGAHRYTSDVKRPAMLYGKVVRPSALNAEIVSVDNRKAAALPGVIAVRDGNFIGVAAPAEHLAARAAALVEAEWKASPQPSYRELFPELKNSPPGPGGRSPHLQGSVEEGLAAAHRKLEQAYTVAYIAHVPLEPRAAVAEWTDGKLTVWTGTQRPFGVRRELAEAFGLTEDRVRVIVPDTGSGYGGKHTGEAAVEAARLAKAAGRPVRIVWTREEEFTWAYFRPAGVIEIRSGVRDDGTLTAWDYHNYNSGASGIRTLYEVPHQRIEFHAARSPLRQGSYRALAATANHFARETHMDELAAALKIDPLEFRLRNLKDARLRAVLEAAADRFGWGRTSIHNPKARIQNGVGIAGGFEKGGYVATCAEIAADRARGQVRVTRLVTAFECGAILNPDHLTNQIEGSVVMGLGGALFEAIRFENGKILNPRFSRYRVPRFSDVPRLETVLVDRKDLPSAGAGETPIVGVAPAVGNAIFNATGIRLRSLPLVPDGLQIDSHGTAAALKKKTAS